MHEVSTMKTPRGFLALTCASILLAACGSTVDGGGSNGPDCVEDCEEPTPADGGTANPEDGGEDGGNSPCVPFGTWAVTYQEPYGCAPPTDVMTVAEDAGGQVLVTFMGDSLQSDDCNDPPVFSTYTATGAASADGCTLEVHTLSLWCEFGEVHKITRDLSLVISGDSASGNLTYMRYWCNDDYPETVAASATRETL